MTETLEDLFADRRFPDELDLRVLLIADADLGRRYMRLATTLGVRYEWDSAALALVRVR